MNFPDVREILTRSLRLGFVESESQKSFDSLLTRCEEHPELVFEGGVKACITHPEKAAALISGMIAGVALAKFSEHKDFPEFVEFWRKEVKEQELRADAH